MRAIEIVRAETRTLDRGVWSPDAVAEGEPKLLLLEGILLREVTIAGRVSTLLLGPGDVVRSEPSADGLVPHEVHWRVIETAVLAVLGDHFELAARRWPSLSRHIAGRLLTQTERVALQLAIAQLPRIEQRIVGVMWHLAPRWGRVTSAGYVVPLRLTHEALGRLVGARRPTVSLALSELADGGQLVRRPDGSWLLGDSSLDVLAGTALHTVSRSG